MKRYEYKVVNVRYSIWQGSSRSEEALLEVLNREGRGGWRIVAMPQSGMIGLRSVLLERTLD